MTVYNVKAAFQYLNGAVHLVHLKFTHQGEYGHHNNHVSQCLESLAEEILPEMLCLLEEIPVVGPVVRLAADLAKHGSMEDTDFDVRPDQINLLLLGRYRCMFKKVDRPTEIK